MLPLIPDSLSRSLLGSVAQGAGPLGPLRPELPVLLSLYVAALGAALRLAPERAFRAARRLAGLCCACALASLLVTMATGRTVLHGPVLLSLGEAGRLTLSLRADGPGWLMLLLVSFLGWVIVGFSQPYERGPDRLRWRDSGARSRGDRRVRAHRPELAARSADRGQPLPRPPDLPIELAAAQLARLSERLGGVLRLRALAWGTSTAPCALAGSSLTVHFLPARGLRFR